MKEQLIMAQHSQYELVHPCASHIRITFAIVGMLAIAFADFSNSSGIHFDISDRLMKKRLYIILNHNFLPQDRREHNLVPFVPIMRLSEASLA